MLIERHASWIALNNVVGCPNDCIYCFLGKNKCTKPTCNSSAKDTVNSLLSSELFDDETPICVMPNTDVFATKENKKAFFDVLEQIKEKNIKNLITVITKREIDKNDAEKIAEYRNLGMNICVYVSYSGLPDSFEHGVRHNGQLDAIQSMQILHEYHIPCVHYWRPLIPQNTDDETIQKVFNNVKKYCIASCMTGLKLYPSMNCKDYWPQVQEAFDKGANPECFVPKGAFEKIIDLAKNNNYQVFVDNICLMASLLKQPCKYGIYKTERCEKYDICSSEQRKICGAFYNYKKPKQIEADKKLSLSELLSKAKKEHVNVQKKVADGQYWQSYFTSEKWMEL